MAYQFPPNVEKLVKEQMAVGGYASEDDLLRDALDALQQFAHSRQQVEGEYREAVAAVRVGVSDMKAGRMRPLRDLISEAGGNEPSETD